MKAVVWTKYGSPDGLVLREVEKPAPEAGEVLIRVRAATVTMGDCELRSLKLPLLFRLPMRLYMGFFRPRNKIIGQELAGEIEAVGDGVERFKPGDAVFAATVVHFGGYAEYACLPEHYPMLQKPLNMSHEEAATIPTGGMNAMHFLRKADIRPGEKLLINGAGGSIGTYAVQIAKALGAEVTAVDSAGKLAMLRSIGADHVVDYEREDFTRSGRTYDVIIDVIGKSSFSRSVKSLNAEGRYVLGNPILSGVIRGLWTSKTSDKKVIFQLADYRMEDMQHLKELIEAGKVKSVIDKRYPLEETAEAHRYVDTGKKVGNVVITT